MRDPKLISWMKDIMGMYEIKIAIRDKVYTYLVEATAAMQKLRHKKVFTFYDLNKIKKIGKLIETER